GVIAFAIALTYVGRFAAAERSDRMRARGAIDLSIVERAESLEPGLAAAFPNADDRQFAAREWFRVLSDGRASGRHLAKVGAAAAATVPVDSILRSPHLDAFANRLMATREAATAAGRPAPSALPLFTAAELAAIKPSFVVRTRAEFRDQLLLWGVLYL